MTADRDHDVPLMFDVDEAVAWLSALGRQPAVEEVGTVLSRLGRVNGPALLVELLWRGKLTEEAAQAHVAAVWSAAEYPQDALDLDDWLALFDLAGYTDDSGARIERPALPLRLYRGAPPERRHRMSWTDDPNSAARFATGGLRGRQAGCVWTTVITEPWRLLAYCNQRDGEREHVIDTDGLVVTRWTWSTTHSPGPGEDDVAEQG